MINAMNETENLLDTQLWHACASGMVQMPPLNSRVFYFPQGHAEHAHKTLDLGIPPLILCRVSSLKYLADLETDEVYAKIGLVPLGGSEPDIYDDDGGFTGLVNNEDGEKLNSFAKILTQSDANNGGGFSVPRYCAETIFPLLDYSAEPPVQTLFAKDVHGNSWKFRHIYRGTPRRHLLTTGWSNFVNQKKLVAGDSVVFMKKENGEIHLGIRRAKRGNYATSLNPGIFGENDKKFIQNDTAGICDVVGMRGRRNVLVESVTEAALLAATGQPFEVVYYPLSGTPEFVVRASAVRDAMGINWYSGMRFRMPFETEDSSRISWFTGTISSAKVADPIKWPNSPWRLLKVEWDQPELLQNIVRVSPWLVELVSDMSPVHQSLVSAPRKKLRLAQPPQFPMFGQLPAPPLFHNPVICASDNNIPAGVQGARHAQCGLSSIDIHFNKVNSELFTFGFREDDRVILPKSPEGDVMASPENEENVSCLLAMGSLSPNLKKNNEEGIPMFMLFGKPIFTEQQMSHSCSGETISYQEKTTNVSVGSGSDVLQNSPVDNSSDGAFPLNKDQKPESGFETSHCNVFMESENVG